MKGKGRNVLPIVLAIIIALSVIMFFMWQNITSYITILEVNWKISIPSKVIFSEIYSKDSDEKDTIFYGNYSNAVNVWLDTIDVPSEYRPDCSKCMFWYNSQDDNSEIIILWDKEKTNLYVVESFL